MRYLIVSDGEEYVTSEGTKHDGRVRFYLHRPDPELPRGCRHRWTFSCQRERAAEFETSEEAQRTIDTKTDHPERWSVVSVSEDEEKRRSP
jgi:hypothetical protein